MRIGSSRRSGSTCCGGRGWGRRSRGCCERLEAAAEGFVGRGDIEFGEAPADVYRIFSLDDDLDALGPTSGAAPVGQADVAEVRAGDFEVPAADRLASLDVHVDGIGADAYDVPGAVAAF